MKYMLQECKSSENWYRMCFYIINTSGRVSKNLGSCKPKKWPRIAQNNQKLPKIMKYMLLELLHSSGNWYRNVILHNKQIWEGPKNLGSWEPKKLQRIVQNDP